MAYTGEQLEATTQLDRARESLGEALGQIQDITNSGINVEHVSASLARSVKNIFNLRNAGIGSPEAPQYILQSMDHLRETLMQMQEVPGESAALAQVTSTVAHILALLYPVSKIIEQVELDNKARAKGEKAPLNVETRAASPEEDSARRQSSIPPRYSTPLQDTGERRSDIRRSINVDIGIHSHTNFFTGFTQDISSGGLFVATYDILSIGTKINVNFSVPDGPVLSCDGIVRWVREYNDQNPEMEPGMGIQFSKLSREDRKAINHYIAVNPPMFYEDGE